MGKLKLVKDKVYKFLKTTWKNYCDNMENCYYPIYMLPTLYSHNFMFYETMMRLRYERNMNSKNS